MLLFEDRSSPTTITISLDESSDGGINLSGHDVGKAPRECFGSDDYEYVLTIPAESLRLLAMALLMEKYADDASAVSQLRDYCDKHAVPCSFWSS